MKTLYERVEAWYASQGYPFHTAPGRLNICHLRGDKVGVWDDLSLVLYTDADGDPQVLVCVTTTDASPEQWLNPTNPDGVAYVVNGFYEKGYVRGNHKWDPKRPAFRQNAPFLNVRWPGGFGWPSPAQLESLVGQGGSFWGLLHTHWHNQYNDATPAVPGRNASQGCTVSLHQNQHALAMELGDWQVALTGVTTFDVAFASLADVLPPIQQETP